MLCDRVIGRFLGHLRHGAAAATENAAAFLKHSELFLGNVVASVHGDASFCENVKQKEIHNNAQHRPKGVLLAHGHNQHRSLLSCTNMGHLAVANKKIEEDIAMMMDYC